MHPSANEILGETEKIQISSKTDGKVLKVKDKEVRVFFFFFIFMSLLPRNARRYASSGGGMRDGNRYRFRWQAF